MYEARKTLQKTYNGGAFGTAAGALVVVIVWLLDEFGNVQMPPVVIAALTTLVTLAITLAAFWLTPLLPGEIQRVPDEIDDLPPFDGVLERSAQGRSDRPALSVPGATRTETRQLPSTTTRSSR